MNIERKLLDVLPIIYGKGIKDKQTKKNEVKEKMFVCLVGDLKRGRSPNRTPVLPWCEHQKRKNRYKERKWKMERYYRFGLITYLEEEELKEKLKHKHIVHWAYAYHDRDVKEGGELKEPHYHVLVTLNSNNSVASIRKKFENGKDNTLAKPLDENLKEAYEYLWHKNEENKYIYDKSIVRCDSAAFWETEANDNDDKNEAFLHDLLSEDYERVRMAKIYGRDYIKNMKAYEYFRAQIGFEKQRTKNEEEYRNIKEERDEMMKNIDETNDWERFRK